VTEGNSRLRLSVIGGVIALLFFGLLGRLWFLQVASSSSYAAATQANRTRVVTDPGARGSILDASGKVVVENRLVTSLQIQRGVALSQLKVTVHNLAPILSTPVKPVTEASLWKQIHDPRLTLYQPIPIKDDLSYDTLVKIKERPQEFPGVIATQRSVRVYPYANPAPPGDLASHLLGYVGAVNGHDLKVHPHDRYTPEDVIGKDGVEQVFEHELRGTPHVRKLEVNSRGRVVRVLNDTPAKTGNSIQLTMDATVQHEAQVALQEGITEVQGYRDTNVTSRLKNFGGTGGAVVVLNARDGSVVALASAPEYQVSQFTSGIPQDQFQALADPAMHFPLLNRATQGLYPPGSTFKLMTAIAALQYGAAVPNTSTYTFNDNGCIKFGSASNPQSFCNAGKTPHGIVDLPHAIEVSSDVYFYNLGLRFFDLWNCGAISCPYGATPKADHAKGYGVQTVAKQFGFGRPSGIGLPQEASGRIPDRTFKAQVNQGNPDPFSRDWLPGDSLNVAVGQGDVLVTPLQLADAYAAFINGGTLYSPRLASRVLAPDGKTVVRELPPQETRKISVSPDIRAQIMAGLVGAVTANDGTAAAAFSGYQGQYPIAGKTGTAQQPTGTEDTSWFVGLVNPDPTDPSQPQYVVVVNVEQAGFGGTVAAPIARRIIETLNGNASPAPVQIAPTKND
jgi:penicillin-binding protein 2